MSEHEIDTGKTFEDAKMKIVLLTSELERVNTYNYSLVRENEVLRVQSNKSEREKDLENKLAIVLAENEKLNQVIEEIYEVYMSQRGYGAGSNEEYEKRITELYQDLEDWKQRYNILENQTNIIELENAYKEIQNERDMFAEQLARKDKDLEILRARLTPMVDAPVNTNAALEAENGQLKRELEAIKLQYGNAGNLQVKINDYENKIKSVLVENDRLNEIVMNQVNEIKDLKAKVKGNQGNQVRVSDFTINLPNQTQENDKSSGANSNLNQRLKELTEENRKLRDQIAENEKELKDYKETKATLERLTIKIKELIQENENLNALALKKSSTSVDSSHQREENKKLKDLLTQKQQEIDELYVKLSEAHQNSLLADQYREKVTLVVQENERLNNFLHAKFEEIEKLKHQIAALEAQNLDPKAYEDRIQLLISENQRLTDLIKDKANEVDSLRVKLYEAQAGSGQVNELMSKISLISAENERLNKEIDRLNGQNNDRFKLELLIEEKNREIEHLRNGNNGHVRVIETEVSELRGQNETLKSAGAEQSRKIGELEGRLSQLITLETKVNYFNLEIEKLHKDVIERENQINALNQRLAEKDREIQELNRRSYNSETEQERRIAAIRDEMEGQIQRLVAEKRQAEENARALENMLREIKAELEEWKRRYIDLEDTRANEEELDELRRQFENLQRLNDQIKEFQQKFAAERAAYETQILQLEDTIEDLQNVNKLLVQENERLTNLSVQRLNQIQEIESRNNEENYKFEIYELKNQLALLKSNSYDVKQLAIQHSAERAGDQAKINELTHVNENLKKNIRELNDLSEQRKADVESLTHQNEDLKAICQKLQKGTGDSRASFNGSIEALQNKISELELSRNEYKRQAERNAIDLTRKNRELIDRIQEVDILKLKYEEALANCQALNSQLFNRLSVKH